MPQADRISGAQLNQLKTRRNNLKIYERYLMQGILMAAGNKKWVKNMQPNALHSPSTG
jgi:hypothetical protein